ncbi:unnamed protein product [Paramecium pentaurelia]|uniref:Uncharacterized protein n=1 Tax=Paramecium pentaurelia TaxID=43138 RepID=A0A8S1UL03_9CILI|nr:unnamed protein product [Paramecium pentaurelia]
MIKDQNKVYGKNQQEQLEVYQINLLNSEVQVQDVGKYNNNLRKGTWKYIFQNQEINDKWIEFERQIFLLFINSTQWFILRWQERKDEDQPFKLIGGRLYDEAGSMKIGKWNEISLGYDNMSQVIWLQWDILFRKNQQIAYKQLGCGLYDEQGSNKIGYWPELSDEFNYESQIVFYDEYQNGKNVSKWITREEGDYLQHYLINKNIIMVEGHIIKVVQLRLESGLKDGFDRWFQAIYYGEYKVGNKADIWDIFLWKPLKQSFELIQLLSKNIISVADHMIKSVQLKLEAGKSQVKDSGIILKSRIMVIITVVKNLEDGTSCMRKSIMVEDNMMKIHQRLEYGLNQVKAFQIIHKSLIMVSIKKGKGWQNGIYLMMKQAQQILVGGLRSAIVLMNILKLLIMVNIKIAERLADGIFCTESNLLEKKYQWQWIIQSGRFTQDKSVD